MPRYKLDTNTCSYIMNRSRDALLKRLRKVPVSDICISAITKSELLYAVEISPRQQQDQAALDALLVYVDVLDCPDEAYLHYDKNRAQLKVHGQRTGSNDLFIAAHARSLGLTLVTNNTREFARVRNLAIENWTIDSR